MYLTHMNEHLHMFTHTQSHTWVARGAVDLLPSLAACVRFAPPLPSLPTAVAAQLPAAAAAEGTKAAFVTSLQLRRLSMGHLA